MTERRLLRLAILVFWTLFWGLSVTDKIIPDVQHLWVGKDFFALFVKFFASLGLKDSLFPTVALAGGSGLEALNFTMYAVALWALWRGRNAQAEVWFFRGIFTSMGLFSLFSGLAVITTTMYGKICFRTPKSQPERSPTAPFLRFPPPKKRE